MRSPVATDPPPDSAGRRLAPAGTARPVVEVRGVEKTFRIPDQRIDSLKERATHPFTRVRYRELRALKGISFDVRDGESFGIVGRNGSGKSTLLKILASIYRADTGRIRMAGRVAPFIELGVGFNPELSGRQNVVLNGVLMGLTRREALARLDAVIEFAELESFADLKLKNYSSGMMVRLAFAVMVEADADIMLIDEVLAVGDAAFAQKCMDVFHARRRAGRTVVLVTHDMATVQLLCHRALLLHEGELQHIGDPEEVALRYYRLNFAEHAVPAAGLPEATPVLDLNVRVLEATVRDQTGAVAENVEQGTPIAVDIVVEAARELDAPQFLLHVVNAAGVVVCAITRDLDTPVAAGRRVRLSGQIENRLVAGRYYIDCWVRSDRRQSEFGVQAVRVLRFLVFGTAPAHGFVTLASDIEPVLEPPPAHD
jgi:ABC-2 type transport system ATP-binding protein